MILLLLLNNDINKINLPSMDEILKQKLICECTEKACKRYWKHSKDVTSSVKFRKSVLHIS